MKRVLDLTLPVGEALTADEVDLIRRLRRLDDDDLKRYLNMALELVFSEAAEREAKRRTRLKLIK